MSYLCVLEGVERAGPSWWDQQFDEQVRESPDVLVVAGCCRCSALWEYLYMLGGVEAQRPGKRYKLVVGSYAGLRSRHSETSRRHRRKRRYDLEIET